MATTMIPQPDADTASIFQSNLSIADKLDRARMELLDLSARNRLLNLPRKNARSVEIVDEKSAEIFRLLVREGKVFTFLAGKAARGGMRARPMTRTRSWILPCPRMMSPMNAAFSAAIPTPACKPG